MISNIMFIKNMISGWSFHVSSMNRCRPPCGQSCAEGLQWPGSSRDPVTEVVISDPQWLSDLNLCSYLEWFTLQTALWLSAPGCNLNPCLSRLQWRLVVLGKMEVITILTCKKVIYAGTSSKVQLTFDIFGFGSESILASHNSCLVILVKKNVI